MTYPPRFDVQKVSSLTREMFKLVPLKVLKIDKPFWKKMCILKVCFLPPDLLADFQQLLSLVFLHVCAVENASEKVKPFSLTSSGLRATEKPSPC